MKKCGLYSPSFRYGSSDGYCARNEPAIRLYCKGQFEKCDKLGDHEVKKQIAYAFTDELKAAIPESLPERDNVIKTLGEYFGKEGVSNLLRCSTKPEFAIGTSELYKAIYDILTPAFHIDEIDTRQSIIQNVESAFAIKLIQGKVSYKIKEAFAEWKPVFERIKPKP